MIERLTVSLDFGAGAAPRRLGTLGRDPSRRSTAFEWDADFARAPLPVSPHLVRNYGVLLRPNARRGASLPGLFEDSLPDGWGRLLLDREMAARGFGAAAMGDIERLAFVGRHGMGAIVYEPETGAGSRGDIALPWFEDAIARVEESAAADELSRLRVIAGGSLGARPKFVALLDAAGERLRDHRSYFEPGWRHVLVKARGSGDPAGSIEAEIAYGAAMRAAGVAASPMSRIAGAHESFFVTDRFDRRDAQRLHMATVAGLLDCGMAHGLVDYVDLVKLAKRVCADASAVLEVFRRMVFNVRAVNRDDHVRNHAFLMDETGSWTLAPAYDVSFSSGPGGEHSIAVAGEGRRPGREAFAEVARIAGLKPRVRDAVIGEVDAALVEWPRLAEEHEVPRALAKRIGAEMEAARRWP